MSKKHTANKECFLSESLLFFSTEEVIQILFCVDAMIEQELPNSSCNESQTGARLCVLTGFLMAPHSDVRSLNFRATNSFVL